jgi:hypothetical protein
MPLSRLLALPATMDGARELVRESSAERMRVLD